MYKVFKACFNMKGAEDAVYVIATNMNIGQTLKYWILKNINSRCYLLHSNKFSDIQPTLSLVLVK